MSILIANELIRPTLYTKTLKDNLYNELMQVLYSEGFMKSSTDKLWYYEENGKNSNCIVDEIMFFNMLVSHLINMQDEIYHLKCLSQEGIDAIVKDYDLTCIRKTVLCRFNNTDLYDKLMLKINMSNDGISNVVLELYNENNCLKPFIVA